MIAITNIVIIRRTHNRPIYFFAISRLWPTDCMVR